MASYLGVDWANGCWLVVMAGDETLITTEPTILNVWHEHGADVQSMLVDIPIGLPDSGPRLCDKEAKSELAGRGSTVFQIPGRPVVQTDEYSTARDENGGKLGSQSWWLFPRILEVDVFLQEYNDALEKIYESHPEVCFAKLSGNSVSGKLTETGREERLTVLERDSELHDQVAELVDEKKARSCVARPHFERQDRRCTGCRHSRVHSEPTRPRPPQRTPVISFLPRGFDPTGPQARDSA